MATLAPSNYVLALAPLETSGLSQYCCYSAVLPDWERWGNSRYGSECLTRNL